MATENTARVCLREGTDDGHTAVVGLDPRLLLIELPPKNGRGPNKRQYGAAYDDLQWQPTSNGS